MISEQTLKTLEMLRKAPKPQAVPVPVKWPRGGRPNPCAMHCLPKERQRSFILVRKARRKQHVGNGEKPAWERFAAAVAEGRLPVGIEISKRSISALLGAGFGSAAGLDALVMELASHGAPCRLRTLGPRGGKPGYRIELV